MKRGISLALIAGLAITPAVATEGIPEACIPFKSGAKAEAWKDREGMALGIAREANKLLRNEQKYEEAAALFKCSASLNGNDERYWLALTESQLRAGRRNEAKKSLASAKRVNPNNAAIWFTEGAIALQEENPRMAIASFNRGLEIEPNNEDARKDLATAVLMNIAINESGERLNQEEEANTRAADYSDKDIHDMCSDAKDYQGCVRVQEGKRGKRTSTPRWNDDVEIDHGFTYRTSTIRQMKVRGSYGRYLTFWGRSMNEYSGTPGIYSPGTPGNINCNSASYGESGTSTNCVRTGYIAPSYSAGTQGGTQKRWFEYELDCKDRTYNRKGDRLSGSFKKGWMDVYYDPTARAVANKFCSRIKRLPKKL